METYELTAVFSVKDNLMQECKAALEQELASQELSIDKSEDMGQRQLAYPIRKELRGHYHFYTFQAERQKIEPLRAAISLLPGLLRFLIIDPAA